MFDMGYANEQAGQKNFDPTVREDFSGIGHPFDGGTEDQKSKDKIFDLIKRMEFTREAEIFKALGHPIRLKIVYGLLEVGGCNVKNMQECLGSAPGHSFPAPNPLEDQGDNPILPSRIGNGLHCHGRLGQVHC